MTFLSIGAHVGDAELMCGPFLCQKFLEGEEVYIVALTSGELGNPHMAPKDYKVQKLSEAKIFSEKTSIEYTVFDDIPDTQLSISQEIVNRVKNIIVSKRTTTVITHWRGSIHSDHRQASEIVSKAVLQINLEMSPEFKVELFYAENWEDMDNFQPNSNHEISEEAFKIWKSAIIHEEFIHGSFSSFRYLDYYSALLITRGCLTKHPKAVVLMKDNALN